jgi:hypothetical protein
LSLAISEDAPELSQGFRKIAAPPRARSDIVPNDLQVLVVRWQGAVGLSQQFLEGGFRLADMPGEHLVEGYLVPQRPMLLWLTARLSCRVQDGGEELDRVRIVATISHRCCSEEHIIRSA